MSQAQQPLFCEDIYDALRAIVQQLGGAKVVGAKLWPHKSVEDARRLCLDCLNAERAEKFDPAQVVLLFRWSREANFHVAKHWFDAETGYKPAEPTSPSDELADLQRQFIASVHEQQTLVKRMERLAGPRAVAA